MSGSPLLAGVRAITFDAGGTLFAPHPSVGAVYREIALRHGCDFTEEALNTGFKQAFHDVSKDSCVLDPEARERDFWRRVVIAAIADLGAEPADFAAFFGELYDAFSHANRWRMLPGVTDTLHVLRGRGFRLGVLSNWDRRLCTVLEETALRPLFDAVVVSSEAGFEKPDAGIFRVAERTLGAGPAECLHVGDSLKHDIEGARAAGWRALLVRNAEGAATADGEIRFLPDLLARLA
ncbi:MAG: HAD-IA family hydrolase [Opitutaceae bacterium]